LPSIFETGTAAVIPAV